MVATKPRFGLGRVVWDAEVEAGRRGDRRIGTEHVLLALLVDADSVPARAFGVSLAAARDALHALDRNALAAVGISLPAADLGRAFPERGRPRLTPGAVAVFKDLGRVSRGERLGVHHVLVALLARERPDPAAELIDALDIHREDVRRRLAET